MLDGPRLSKGPLREKEDPGQRASTGRELSWSFHANSKVADSTDLGSDVGPGDGSAAWAGTIPGLPRPRFPRLPNVTTRQQQSHIHMSSQGTRFGRNVAYHDLF